MKIHIERHYISTSWSEKSHTCWEDWKFISRFYTTIARLLQSVCWASCPWARKQSKVSTLCVSVLSAYNCQEIMNLVFSCLTRKPKDLQYFCFVKYVLCHSIGEDRNDDWMRLYSMKSIPRILHLKLLHNRDRSFCLFYMWEITQHHWDTSKIRKIFNWRL